MQLPQVLAGYRNAISVASAGATMRVPAMACSVLRARLGFQIGPRYHSLFDLKRLPAQAWKEYIQDKDANPVLLAVNKQENLAWGRDKAAFTAHCVRNGLPAIPIICVIARMDMLDLPGISRVASAEELTHALVDAPERLFVKLLDGAHGEDAFSVRRKGQSWSFDGQTGQAADLYRFCMQRLGERTGWLIQPAIEPHPALAQIMGGALGTVRAVTYLSGAGPRILLPVLRMPAGGNVTDNFSEGTAGNIVAPIDLATGILGAGRTSRSRDWPDMVSVEEHPDTGCRIEGFQLPCWPQAVDLMLRAQERTPRLRTLGWDIALTGAGPVIVESNTGYDVNLLQVAYGRGIRRDLEPIFGML